MVKETILDNYYFCTLLLALNPDYAVDAYCIIWVKIARIVWQFAPKIRGFKIKNIPGFFRKNRITEGDLKHCLHPFCHGNLSLSASPVHTVFWTRLPFWQGCGDSLNPQNSKNP